MSPEKPINTRARATCRPIRSTPVPRKRTGLPPLFLTLKLLKSIERLLPADHHKRMRLYFDTYGCLRCCRKNVIYGCNGFCRCCQNMIRKRLRIVDRNLRATRSDPGPKLKETYLQPYNSARQLLADLVPKIDKRSTRRPLTESPLNVYIKH